ncbi:MAG: FtsQ-type POTRA domain-containing protein [Candidatus Aegiribacteria sp.]|nr:FtsQ-type POTRA domain-containing protein [Candidatus Aegiribacteria sp.]
MKDRRRIAFWLLLVSGLSAFALAMGYRWFERGGAFDLDTVRIRGIRHADSSAICEVVKPLFGTSIWQIDPVDLQNMLSDIPGIDFAHVNRAPLSGLIFDIRISEPVFAVSDSSGVAAVSSIGEVLPPRFLTDSIPVVESQERIDAVVSRKLAAWFRSEDIQYDSLLFRYTDRGLSVFVGNGCEVLLGIDHLSDRWDDYQQLASSLSGSDNWYQVDMRYANQAVMRKLDGNSPPQGGEM